MPARPCLIAGGQVLAFVCAACLLFSAVPAHAQARPPAPVALLDVPFISQSEALCGGAAAAMVLRYWGERGVAAESFVHLLDRSAAGIRTTALMSDLRGRGWAATAIEGRKDLVREELSRGRPVLALIEDRPGTFHYLVIVAWHEKGVVFHDPARAPFRVMNEAEFDRRWRVSDRWMAVVLPGTERLAGTTNPIVDAGFSLREGPADVTCDGRIAEGVRHAQSKNFDAAERALTSALECPGPAAARELAGVRLLQQRWPEVTDLASAALAEDASDAYAWKLLATARFVQNDRVGALDAWNHAGEPRVDLVRVDGLTRTRHRVVEDLVGARAGEVLTATRFMRARRRLAELPSAVSTRLDYVPVPSGLAELRGAVAERALFPTGRLALAALGVSAAATREARVVSGSLTGGGEQLSAAWRFWPGRPRVAADVRSPAPWGGIWGLGAFTEQQPFTDPDVPRADRTGASLQLSDWATDDVRVEISAGVDRWTGAGTFGRVGGGARWLSLGDRMDTRVAASGWLSGDPFGELQASVHARSSTELRGVVGLVRANIHVTSDGTPMDLWSAGDTGHARQALLRAHPVLDDGRLRSERLGRTLMNLSVEAQRWWRAAGLLRTGAAAFVDVGRTSRRMTAGAVSDADVGLGARLAVSGIPGLFRVDLAKGLRDGATALSFVYEP